MTVLTLQPDATAGKDTIITARAPATNYGGEVNLNIGELNITSGGADRELIQFDLSAIPASATVSSVVLSIYANGDYSTNARTLRAFRVKRAWVESQASWNVYSTGNPWSTPGAFGASDCEQTDIGSLALSASETLNTFKEFALTPSAVQEWISGAFANNGMLLKMDTELNDGYTYASSDNATAANRPKLTISYTLATGDAPFSRLFSPVFRGAFG